MRAGKLDRRVQIWKQSPVTDQLSGQPKEKFALWQTVWAQLMPISSVESFNTETLRTETVITWKMRPVAGLSTKDQIRHGGRIYKITGILETERRREITVNSEAYE